jgi:Family of unknown function (DUF6260)
MLISNAQVDFITNGRGYGQAAQGLEQVRFDTGLCKPYLDSRDRLCVTVNTRKRDGKGFPVYRKVLVSNLNASGMGGLVVNGPTALRKLEWVYLDQQILRAARERLRAWSDLSAASSFGGFDAMSKSMLEHETMSDPGEALVDMDGLSESRGDSPLYQLQGLPLPLTHSGFSFSSRRLSESRNSNTPLDMQMGEACGRRVAEKIEQTLIGTITGLTYGGTPIAYGRTSSVYGYLNFPAALTYTSLKSPTDMGWTAGTTLGNVLAMIEQLMNQNFFGPFMLYHSTDWDQYLDNDYILTGGNVATQTLRDRLRAIDAIIDVRRLDYLKSSTNPFTFIMVQLTSEVARAVNGMDITTVQWPTMGGLQLNFKVMAIQVPQLRADHYQQCGILVAVGG